MADAAPPPPPPPTAATAAAAAGKKTAAPRMCRRCKVREGVHAMRDDPSCDICFVQYVATKMVKKLEAMNKELVRAQSQNKAVGAEKQQQQQQQQRGGSASSSPRYAVALSCGPSSAGMLEVLYDTMTARRKRNSKAVYELHVIHIDTRDVYGGGRGGREGQVARRGPTGGDATATATATPPPPPPRDDPLAKWRERYPDARFESVPLAPEDPAVLQRLLPSAGGAAASSCSEWTLGGFLAALPSATSRTDVSRILVQQQLMAWAAANGCCALLLGHTATAMSELALAEVAKGRGYGVPWLLTDGPIPMRVGDEQQQQQQHTVEESVGQTATATEGAEAMDLDRETDGGENSGDGTTKETSSSAAADQKNNSLDIEGSWKPSSPPPPPSPASPPLFFPVYHLLRELFRSELELYATLLDPPLAPLLPAHESPTAPVVSLRDVSIEQVVARYFRDNDQSYMSMVSNVVRTVDKLARPPPVKPCVLCAQPVDDEGDARWWGEIPDDPASRKRMRPDGIDLDRVCYGCKRSLYG